MIILGPHAKMGTKYQKMPEMLRFLQSFGNCQNICHRHKMSVIRPDVNILRSSFCKQLYIYISNHLWRNYGSLELILHFSRRWWIDKSSAQKSDFRLQKLLWAFASANNCFNPLLYRMVDHIRYVLIHTHTYLITPLTGPPVCLTCPMLCLSHWRCPTCRGYTALSLWWWRSWDKLCQCKKVFKQSCT